MPSILSRLFLVILFLGVSVMFTAPGHAISSPSAVSGGQWDEAMPLVKKVHGFHCRKEKGWDQVKGYYRYHRHKGICRNLQRCKKSHKRCLRVLGRGWDKWEFMRWGWDNWKYHACMVRADCY